jgi:hypothetical protein
MIGISTSFFTPRIIAWMPRLEIGSLILPTGKVQVFEEEGILLGLRDLGEKVFVEFLVGRKAAKDPVGITGKILELAGGRPVEAATKRPSVMRLMLKVGFQPTTVYMRYGYGRRS